MKPNLGPGKDPEPASSEPKPIRQLVGSVDVESEASDMTTPPSEFTRPLDSTSTRPDLGPPAPGPQSTNQPGSGLGLIVSVAIAAIVFAMAIYATGSPTTNPLPLAQTTNALFWIVGVGVVAAAAGGAVYADRTASRARDHETPGSSSVTTAWVIPLVATTTAIVLVATFHNQAMFVAGPLIAFLGNAGALLSRDLLDDADDSAQRTATTIHALVIHLVALLAMNAIYLNKLSTPLSALLAGLTAALLTAEALDRSPANARQKTILAFLAGAAVAAAAAPLMWWPTFGLTGGTVLFVVFYSAVGVAQSGLERQPLWRRYGILYGLAPLAALLILAFTA